jgi:hypothetical protein
MKDFRFLIKYFLILFFFCNTALAQTTGSIYGSTITAGQQGIEYRMAFVPDDGETPSYFSQRVHYQKSVNNNIRLRALIQGSDKTSGDIELDLIQAELLWQFRSRASHGWDSALRFDARLNQNNGADRFALNWSSQLDFAERWRARFIALTARELGSKARSGVAFQTRGQISYGLQSGPRIALEMFNSYGRTPSFGSFKTQRHQIGPAIIGRFENGLTYTVGALFGVSASASDFDLRIFLGKGF